MTDTPGIPTLDDQIASGCHPARRAYSGGLCRSCYDRQRYQRRPELLAKKLTFNKKYHAEYYEKNKARIRRRLREEWAGQDIAVNRGDTLWRRYRITLKDYDAMVTAQGGVCAICLLPPRGKTKGKVLYVDHVSGTKKVRGLLCAGCNTSLGQYRHSPEILMRAIQYLRRADGS